MKRNKNWIKNVEIRPRPRPGLNWLTAGISVSDVELSKLLAPLGFSSSLPNVSLLPILPVTSTETAADRLAGCRSMFPSYLHR